MISLLRFYGYFCFLYDVTSKDVHAKINEWHGKANEQPRIYSGTLASIRDYPFYVMILRNYPGRGWKYLCGGSLITLEVTLTACHCSDQGPIRIETYVVGGTENPWTSGEGKQGSHIRYAVHHPLCGKKKYKDYPRDYDVGVMIHRHPFNSTPYVRPLKLYSRYPERNMRAFRRWAASYETCFVIGNGLTSWRENASMSDHMLVGRTIALTNEKCSRTICIMGHKKLCGYDFEEHGQLCMYATESMPCGSDSGGPIVIRGFVVGVVSWTTECKLGYLSGAANVKGITDVANWFLYPPGNKIHSLNMPRQGHNTTQEEADIARNNSSFFVSPSWIAFFFSVIY